MTSILCHNKQITHFFSSAWAYTLFCTKVRQKSSKNYKLRKFIAISCHFSIRENSSSKFWNSFYDPISKRYY